MPSTRRLCEVCSGTQFAPLFQKDGHAWQRCTSCALERIDPPPTDETLSAIYGKHYYDAWGLHNDASTVSALKKATFSGVLRQLPASPAGAKLLDCGAATGFLLEVAKGLGYTPYGIELSEFGARAIADKFGVEHAFQGEIEDATFPDAPHGSFQVVTMCDYIEHVRSPLRTLERARALLAAGGALALTTPDTGSLTHIALRRGWSHYKIEHLYYFRRDNLSRLLRSAGFTEVSFKPLWKTLNLRYIREQFDVYPHPVLSRVSRGLGAVLPEHFQSRRVRFLTGELLAVARAG